MKTNTLAQRRYAAHAWHIRRNERSRARRLAYEKERLARRQAREAQGQKPFDPRLARRMELGSQTRIEDLWPQVNVLLKAFGYPGALVTDESLVWDMLRDGRKLVAIRRKLKVPISTRDYIFVVAERLAAKRK